MNRTLKSFVSRIYDVNIDGIDFEGKRRIRWIGVLGYMIYNLDLNDL